AFVVRGRADRHELDDLDAVVIHGRRGADRGMGVFAWRQGVRCALGRRHRFRGSVEVGEGHRGDAVDGALRTVAGGAGDADDDDVLFGELGTRFEVQVSGVTGGRPLGRVVGTGVLS